MRLTSIVLQIAMHRVLNVAEKNDAAKSLARLLSKSSASMVNKSIWILNDKMFSLSLA